MQLSKYEIIFPLIFTRAQERVSIPAVPPLSTTLAINIMRAINKHYGGYIYFFLIEIRIGSGAHDIDIRGGASVYSIIRRTHAAAAQEINCQDSLRAVHSSPRLLFNRRTRIRRNTASHYITNCATRVKKVRAKI